MLQRRILLLSMLFMVCFLLVAAFRSSFSAVDLNISFWSASVNMGFFTLAAQIFSIVFDSIILTILSFVVAIFLFVLNHRRYGLLLLGAMAGVTLLVALFKTVIMSPRPLNEIIIATGSSFPSGHTTSSLVFFGIITYFFWKNWHSAKVKILTGGLYISITAVVGFDRIYLNVHWFSDIVGSVFLGSFWLTFCILLFKYLESNRKIQRFLSRDSRSKKSAQLAGFPLTQKFQVSRFFRSRQSSRIKGSAKIGLISHTLDPKA